MVAIYIGILGLIAFLVGVGIMGIWLRRHPSKENAEKSSRIMHFLFFAGLGSPFVIGFFYPGLNHLDGWVGLNPLPFHPLFLITGILLAFPGLFFMGASNKSLRALGSGANVFRLTERIVEKEVYQYTRNPMSLGYYLIGFSIAFISGSTLLTIYVLLGVLQAHLFYLKFFEEFDLELRFGETFKVYKQEVAFLIPKWPAEQFSV